MVLGVHPHIHLLVSLRRGRQFPPSVGAGQVNPVGAAVLVKGRLRRRQLRHRAELALHHRYELCLVLLILDESFLDDPLVFLGAGQQHVCPLRRGVSFGASGALVRHIVEDYVPILRERHVAKLRMPEERLMHRRPGFAFHQFPCEWFGECNATLGPRLLLDLALLAGPLGALHRRRLSRPGFSLERRLHLLGLRAGGGDDVVRLVDGLVRRRLQVLLLGGRLGEEALLPLREGVLANGVLAGGVLAGGHFFRSGGCCLNFS